MGGGIRYLPFDEGINVIEDFDGEIIKLARFNLFNPYVVSTEMILIKDCSRCRAYCHRGGKFIY